MYWKLPKEKKTVLHCLYSELNQNCGNNCKNSGKLLLVTVKIVMYAKLGSLANCIFHCKFVDSNPQSVTTGK